MDGLDEMYVRLSMRRHQDTVLATFLDCGGQGDVYTLELGRDPFVLKFYLRQPEAQARLRQLSEKFEKLSAIPGPLERSRVLDWGSASYRGRMVPAALFHFVPGRPLYSHNPESDCDLSRGNATDSQRRKWTRDLVEAVSYLHKNRIVHADLSPKNVLLDEASSELTVIDLDGAGILEDEGSGWASPPLVAGLSGLPGFPPPAEMEDESVFVETDYWWTAMLVFYIATSVHPFFFLRDIDAETLVELVGIIRRAETATWPPDYRLVRTHSRFDERIRADDYEWVVERAHEIAPTNAFFRTLGTGYSNRKVRIPVGFLFRELASLGI